MTLAYKAWRESRARFLVSAAAVVWFSGLSVTLRSGVRQALAKPFVAFVNDNIYGGGVRDLYILFIIVLGLGGLLQEQALGSAPLTLALPVRRRRLVAIRGAVGLLEIAGLALLPGIVVCTLGPLDGQFYPVMDALRRSTQWTASAAALFAAAFFVSHVIAGSYSALGTSLAALFVYSVMVNVPPISHVASLNLFRLMTSDRFEPLMLLAALLVAGLAVAAAALITERRDF